MSIETFTFHCYSCDLEFPRDQLAEVQVPATMPVLGAIPVPRAPMTSLDQPMAWETALICAKCEPKFG